MTFRDPVLLLLLTLIPLIVMRALRGGRPPAMRFPALRELGGCVRGGRGIREYLPLAFRCPAIFLVVLGLARPMRGIAHTKVFTEGIDIILAIDISSSMDARDMTGDIDVNRLDAVRSVVERFVHERANDRIGVVAFARYAYAMVPLTLDHDILLDVVGRLKTVPQGGDEDGTAIGSAIITSSARLKESEAKSKVVILLTDGMNNFGEIGPESAAEVAKGMKIKIYTIGAGTKGLAPYPVRMFGQIVMRKISTDIDEESLRKVAELTGGRYFRAQDEKGLRAIYDHINEMERVKIEEEKYVEYREIFPCFLLPGLFLLLAELVLGQTAARRLP